MLGKEVLAIENDVAEVADPVAEDDDTGLVRQLQVDVDVAMSVDEVVYVGVVLDVLLRIEDEVLTVFTHVGGLFAVRTLA